jgi:hypothetical protein
MFPQLPPAVHVKREFADYDASYAVKNGVLTAERTLMVKAREVQPKDYEEYKKFREVVDADYIRYTLLSNDKQCWGAFIPGCDMGIALQRQSRSIASLRRGSG